VLVVLMLGAKKSGLPSEQYTNSSGDGYSEPSARVTLACPRAIKHMTRDKVLRLVFIESSWFFEEIPC
jgi:hypothetical protein